LAEVEGKCDCLARIYLVDGHLPFSFYLLSVCRSGRRLDPAK
jgi:hypothetical protein